MGGGGGGGGTIPRRAAGAIQASIAGIGDRQFIGAGMGQEQGRRGTDGGQRSESQQPVRDIPALSYLL